MKCETMKNIVISAIALKRYQTRHNQLPDTLAMLVPNLLPSVPVDCIDDRPLRYHLNDDGTFMLYSVGFNGKDDGGDPALLKNAETADEDLDYYDWLSNRALDWVWPQPATEKEIQDYYAHPPR